MTRMLPEPPHGGGWFAAKFPGTCGGCRAPIYVGEWVAYSREEPGVLLCAPCVRKEREDAE